MREGGTSDGEGKFYKTTVSVADIMRMKNLNRLAAYTRNESIVGYFKSENYRLKFIIYGQTILRHLVPAFVRRGLLDDHAAQSACNLYRRGPLTLEQQ